MMDANVTAYPLQWPIGRRRTERQSPARFDREVSLAETRKELLAELGRYNARRVTISSNLRLRLDGLPASGQAQPADRGVAVYFFLDGNKPHCIACDRWDRVEHNLRAIARTISAQRGILRWGAMSATEVFAGLALPSPEMASTKLRTVEDAVAWLEEQSGLDLTALLQPGGNDELLRSVKQQLSRRLHPDANAGVTLPEWGKLQDAISLMKKVQVA